MGLPRKPTVKRYVVVLLSGMKDTWLGYRGPGWAPAFKSHIKAMDDWACSCFESLELAKLELRHAEKILAHTELEPQIKTASQMGFPRMLGWQGDPDKGVVQMRRAAFIEGCIWGRTNGIGKTLGSRTMQELMVDVVREAHLRYR